jgi:hypothetical protein
MILSARNSAGVTVCLCKTTSDSAPTCGGAFFPGEENIMYGAYLATKKTVRFNVDTEQITYICSYDPGDERDVSQVRVMGWTTDSIPDRSRDGRQLVFPSCDGKYSPDDHTSFGSAPWGYCGMFLADLVLAAGNDDVVAPSVPADLKGVFVPSTQSVLLAWNRCTDNVGVDAYNVYRDGQKIATTGFTDHIDNMKGAPSASHKYSVSAIDVAGNEAKSAEITVSLGTGVQMK